MGLETDDIIETNINPVTTQTEGCTAPFDRSLLDSSDTSSCPLKWMGLTGTQPGCITNTTLGYITKYVSFAVITGSSDKFFRADLGLCSWMYHAPESSLFFFSDKADTATDRRGTWVEDKIPEGVLFTKQQAETKGYHLGWVKAQFRFLFGIKHIIEVDRDLGTQKKWFLLIDDDTFINLDGLVVKLQEYDRRPPKSGKHGRYLGERGWGGAGHFFDKMASQTLLKKLHSVCIDKYMIKSFHASDVTLRKCAPLLKLETITEGTMSHCQANHIRERLLTGRHVTMHIKREMTKPDMLAAWRTRLIYQTVYHRNVTAYKLLMKVGNCAYGGCKHPACGQSHDKAAMELFLEVSQNATVMPNF